MKQRAADLNLMCAKLNDLMVKKEVSTTLADYTKQVKSKKLLVK